MRRLLARGPVPLVTAVALALSGAVAVLLAGSAGAAQTLAHSDACHKLTFNLHMPQAPIKFSKCRSDTGESPVIETNGSGDLPQQAIGAGAGTITWTPPYEGGKTGAPAITDLNGITMMAVGGPGQPPDENDGTLPCPAGQQEFDLNANVGPNDTTDPPPDNDVGGTAFAEVCLNGATGAVALEPGTAFEITSPQPGGLRERGTRVQ